MCFSCSCQNTTQMIRPLNTFNVLISRTIVKKWQQSANSLQRQSENITDSLALNCHSQFLGGCPSSCLCLQACSFYFICIKDVDVISGTTARTHFWLTAAVGLFWGNLTAATRPQLQHWHISIPSLNILNNLHFHKSNIYIYKFRARDTRVVWN